MSRARIAAAALLLVLAARLPPAAAQEVVLNNGAVMVGELEKYENGLAYIWLVEGGERVLTTLPESAIDKAATAEGQQKRRAAPPPRETVDGPIKLPHNDTSGRPDIAGLANQERGRRQVLRDTGEASGRVFSNDDAAAGEIPTPTQVLALANMRDQPLAEEAVTDEAIAYGLEYYEQT